MRQKVLKLLENNARLSLKDIGEELNISEIEAIKIVEELEADKIIVDTKTRKFKATGKPQGWLTMEKDLMTQENLKKLKE